MITIGSKYKNINTKETREVVDISISFDQHGNSTIYVVYINDEKMATVDHKDFIDWINK